MDVKKVLWTWDTASALPKAGVDPGVETVTTTKHTLSNSDLVQLPYLQMKKQAQKDEVTHATHVASSQKMHLNPVLLAPPQSSFPPS